MPISLKSTLGSLALLNTYTELKSSIVLFDLNPGTRTWVVPAGVTKIRAFVVGGGGGADTRAASVPSGAGGGYAEKIINVTPGQSFSYTVGGFGVSGDSDGPTKPSDGGTSSFAGLISATGGGCGKYTVGAGVGGIGVGGDINTSGGNGYMVAGNSGGGSSGHAYGNGRTASSTTGAGWSHDWFGFIDGWKIGLLPRGNAGDYGCGAGAYSNTAGFGVTAGFGAGGNAWGGPVNASVGGVGGGAGSGRDVSRGGTGLVGIEVIE